LIALLPKTKGDLGCCGRHIVIVGGAAEELDRRQRGRRHFHITDSVVWEYRDKC